MRAHIYMCRSFHTHTHTHTQTYAPTDKGTSSSVLQYSARAKQQHFFEAAHTSGIIWKILTALVIAGMHRMHIGFSLAGNMCNREISCRYIVPPANKPWLEHLSQGLTYMTL